MTSPPPADPAPPSPPPSRRRRALTALLVAAAAVGAAVADRALAGRRALHVVNATPWSATVLLDEGRAVEVPAEGRERLTVGEGAHTARVRYGPHEETVDLAVSSGALARWGLGPASVFLLNVGGAAGVVREEAVYSADADAPEPAPPELFVGERFVALHGVDVVLAPFPEEVEAPGRGVVRKTRVGLIEGRPASLPGQLPPGVAPERLLDLLERRLELTPADEELLRVYAGVARAAGGLERYAGVLEAGLEREGIGVLWHRLHQDLRRARGEDEALVAEYERRLAAAPEDPDLLYLRARLEADARRARELYGRALAADPDHGWAHHALAFQRASLGELEAGREHAERARALRPEDADTAELLFELRVRLGEAARLREELEAARARAPLDPNLQRRLLIALAADGALDEAGEVHARYARQVEGSRPGDPGGWAAASRLTLLDLQGDPDALLAAVPALSGRLASLVRLQGLLEADRLEAAGELAGEGGALASDAEAALLLSLAWTLRGADDAAATWRERAAARYAQGDPRQRRVARLLRGGEPDPTSVALAPADAAVLLTALAAARPQERSELLDPARRLATTPVFPGPFLRRVQDALSSR